MIIYRIYTIGPHGHFANIEVAECADDKEVVEKRRWRKRTDAPLKFGTTNHGNLSTYRQRFFGAAEVKAMTAAYEAALVDLGLVDRDDPITETQSHRQYYEHGRA
jgi:hypothetical protein